MANVIIARRRDPVILPNDRAKQLKQTLLATQDKSTMIDLGAWMGALSEIKSIEIDEDTSSHHIPVEDIGKPDTKGLEAFASLSPEERAEMLSEFVLNYQKTHEFKRPPFEILEQARDIQLAYYRNNPEAQFVPKEEYNHLLK